LLVRLALLAAITATTFVAVQQADAWHAVDVQVSAKCNAQTGNYDVTATILQSQDWPGATVKSLTPLTLPGSTAGTRTITVVIGWAATSETQTFTRAVTLSGQCVVVCVPQVVEKIVYVDRPVEVVREVPGPERIVYVDRPAPPPAPITVTKTVTLPAATIIHYVPKKPRVVTRWRTRTVVKRIIVTKIVHDRCPPPPVCCEGKG
jgi:hypothetical protein